MYPYRIGHGVSNGGGRGYNRWLPDTTGTVQGVFGWHLDNDTLNVWHVESTGDLVVEKTGIDVPSRFGVKHHLFRQPVAQGLCGTTLHLAFNRHGVESKPGILDHGQVHDLDLSSIRIDFNLSDLQRVLQRGALHGRGGRRCGWAALRHRRHFVDITKRHATVRRAFSLYPSLANLQVVDVGLELSRRDLEELLPELFSSDFDRHAHTADDVTPSAERRHRCGIRIPRQHSNFLEANAEFLTGDLLQGDVRTAEIHRAG